jgi:hypothetical protein
MTDGYEQGYRDGEADQFERITRVYDDLPSAPQEFEPSEFDPVEYGLTDTDDESESPDGSDEPEKPFSVDDIE